MIRNEYRRAFIMLRAAMPGYGGHVRLERRTLNGSMYFAVTAPEGAGTLRAALAGRKDGQYYATPLGTLTRDRRGQLTLAWQFDPRSIDGRPLESYAWVVVADTGGGCATALTGNVEGSREVDPAALERAVCAAVLDAPAADLPAPGATTPPATTGNDTASTETATPQSAESAAETPSAGNLIDSRTEQPSADAATDATTRQPIPVGSSDITTGQPGSGNVADVAVSRRGSDAATDAAASDGPTQGDVKIYTSMRRRIFKRPSSKSNGNQPSNATAAPDAASAEGAAATDGTASTEGSAQAPTAQSSGSAAAEEVVSVSPAQSMNGAQSNGAAPVTVIHLTGGAAANSALSNTPAQSSSSAQSDGATYIPPTQPSNGAHSDGTASAIPTDNTASAGTDAAQSAPAGPDAAQSSPQTAASRLGLDITRPWSPMLEPLRRLFATQAPAEGAPEDDYIYIRAPMPPASGFPYCLVGLRAENGRVTHLRYALPARYAPEPPAGLENYRWVGGGGDGHWVHGMRL